MSNGKETNLQEPVNGDVFSYLKNLLADLKSSDFTLKQSLHFFATGEFDENITDIIHALVSVAPHFIKFPIADELLKVQQSFYDVSQSANPEFGFPNLIGVVDCVHVCFQPYDVQNMEMYLNCNSQYSINVQVVCGPDLQIYNVLAAFPGKFDNLEIWKNSRLCEQLKNGDNTCWLVGDAKYYQQQNLMTPISPVETRADQSYNDAHRAVYKHIKYCLKTLTTRFKCLNSALNFNPNIVCAIIIACCVLHNICINLNDLIEIDTSEIDAELQPEEQINFEDTEPSEDSCDKENK